MEEEEEEEEETSPMQGVVRMERWAEAGRFED